MGVHMGVQMVVITEIWLTTISQNGGRNMHSCFSYSHSPIQQVHLNAHRLHQVEVTHLASVVHSV